MEHSGGRMEVNSMAEQRDEEEFGGTEGSNEQQTTGQQGQQSQFGQQQGKSPTGQSGQPIGGNDSSTGSGPPLSQGSEFGAQSGGQSSSGQAQSGSGSDT